ncbi:hypothetical protein E0379_04345 [Campylobacter upsaliensis]|nr:hypothetical protein [Campylobacter upsaliensis]EAJ7577348.1 hypothetical protein [Campylobacter upsaliensis]EAJ8474834.1 hypothetical protein [Campylobacter upsaliensis]EAJ8485235.1 hypothetical protein [Campylobacter upsaliensis]EAK2739387.1 hypothetical protein [Campylobacter upsaliensis]
MKLDRVKEEIANIRRMQNIIFTVLIATSGYLLTAKGIGEIGAFGAMFFIVFLFIGSLEFNSLMKKKLDEIEKLKRTNDDGYRAWGTNKNFNSYHSYECNHLYNGRLSF